jgi:iron complex outermembrane receptor protein
VRYSSFSRKISAQVNPVTGTQSNSNNTWNGLQPSFYALYHVSPNASVYAQYARGFLAPKDKLAYQPNPAAANAISPQHTTNLQLGGTWKTGAFTMSGDVYHIKFDNFFTYSQHGATVVPVGGGSAVFKGVELEGNYVLAGGLSVYANYSHNNQTYADGTPVQYAPDGTYAGGLVYDDSTWYGSLLTKHIGSTWQGGNGGSSYAGIGAYNTTYGAYQVAGFTTTDLNLGYTVKKPIAGLKDLKVRVNVSNLTNHRQAYYVYGSNFNGDDMFMTLPGRSYMLSLSTNM